MIAVHDAVGGDHAGVIAAAAAAPEAGVERVAVYRGAFGRCGQSAAAPGPVGSGLAVLQHLVAAVVSLSKHLPPLMYRRTCHKFSLSDVFSRPLTPVELCELSVLLCVVVVRLRL